MPNALSVTGKRNCQSPQPHRGKLLREFLRQRGRQYPAIHLAIRQSEIAGDCILRSLIYEDVSPGDTFRFVLPGDLLKIPVERLDSAVKTAPIMIVRKRLNPKHGRWS